MKFINISIFNIGELKNLEVKNLNLVYQKIFKLDFDPDNNPRMR